MRLTLKLGGSILEDESVRKSILAQISGLHAAGHEIILVHGGGKSLNRRLSQLGITSRFVNGLRVTDPTTLDVALMVLAGEVNKRLVLELNEAGTCCAGICGLDASAVQCLRLSDLPGHPEDLGFVGKPVTLDRRLFDLLLGAGIVPVVASIAVGPDSHAYNVNADQMASICAWGTASNLLIYLTDVPGVLNGDGQPLRSLGQRDLEGLRAQGIITGGMLPKVESCIEALEHGVAQVHIVPGIVESILPRSLEGTGTTGTRIHRSN